MMLPKNGFLARGDKPIRAAIGGAEFYCSVSGAVIVVIDDVETRVDAEDVRAFSRDLSTVMYEAERYRSKVRGDLLPSASIDGSARVLTLKSATRFSSGGTWVMRLSKFVGRKSWRLGDRVYSVRDRAHVPAEAVERVNYPNCELCRSEMRLGWIEANPVPYGRHPPRMCEECMGKAVALGSVGKGLAAALLWDPK
jgi:hypothetical protein